MVCEHEREKQGDIHTERERARESTLQKQGEVAGLENLDLLFCYNFNAFSSLYRLMIGQ